MEANKNIYAKIQAVAADLISIEKDMQVGSGSYAYKAVSDLQVTKKVKEAEQKHGIVSIPVSQKIESFEALKTQTKNGEKITYSMLVKMTLRIFDVETGESIEIETFGHGVDSGDKAPGKASTYARKYGLLNAYKIATGEDPDAEKSKDIETTPQPSEKEAAVKAYLLKNTAAMQAILQHFNLPSLDDLGPDQITKIYDGYKRKGVL